MLFRSTLQLPVTGNGAVVVGMRILQGEDTIASTLQPFTVDGSQTLTVSIAVPASPDLQVQWQLFDAGAALVPVTDLTLSE